MNPTKCVPPVVSGKRTQLVAVMILVLTTPIVSVHANLLDNGSFEIGPAVPSPPGYLILGGGDTSIQGWTVIAQEPGATIDYAQNVAGSRILDLNGTSGPGGIEQTITTIVGQLYRVQFDIASNPNPPPVKTMEVVAAGQSQQFTVDNTGYTHENMGWFTKVWTFQATAPQTTLQFLQVFPYGGNEGVLLDNVMLNEVPEPASVVLSALGFVGLLVWRRRKR